MACLHARLKASNASERGCGLLTSSLCWVCCPRASWRHAMQRANRPAGMGRRGVLAAVGLAAAGVAVLGQSADPAVAHDLRPDDPKYKFDRYEAVVNNPKLKVRVVFQWPNIANPIIFG